MKIVHGIGWYFPEALGGTEVYVRALCRLMREAGHQVLVAAPEPVPDGFERGRTYEYDGATVFRYPIPARPTREESQGSITVRGADRFHRWLADEQPDVVHLHTFVTGLGLPELRAARGSGARTIVTTHSSSLGFLCLRGTLMQWGEHACDGLASPSKCAACVLDGRGVPRPIARAIASAPAALARAAWKIPGRLSTMVAMSDVVRRNLERECELVSTADRFVVLTEGARQILQVNGVLNSRVVVNRLGTAWDERSSSHVLAPAPRTALPVKIGYVGRFDRIKGVAVLAGAVARLPKSVRVTVEFRGRVQTDAEHEVLAELNGIVGGDPRVTFAAPVPHEGVADVLRGYDVLCCPAVCFEGGPTVALEAQSVGTPVIGSRIGGLAEIVQDGVNGRLVPPGDEKALAALLLEMATDPAGTIDRWRRAPIGPRTMTDVACEYLRLYQN
jgi:glycosyltransferase involved in cell wall biosynthesis